MQMKTNRMKYWLDQRLNQVSMYRLLSIALASMLVASIGLALVNALPYTASAMICSATILIISAYGFNVLFGWLCSVRTHNESSFITALILFFLFSPTTAIGGLSMLALVAMIAMASKYVFAIHGRHIFNPAAISVVIVGMLGVGYATWWIATPVLLPATLLFTLLILYKTRRLKLGFVFLSTAVTFILGTALVNGQTLLSAVALLPSWPLLFFTGFMLSEPLTLPPRQWQRYLVGIVVGVLFALPFDIGVLSGGPALALVIGNALGFALARRQHVQLVFRERRPLSATSDEYIFDTNRPVNFTAGQYMEITLPHKHKDGRGLRRIFSITSTPRASTVRFGIKTYDRPSSFKKALTTLQPGAIITATGIGGDFVLPRQPTTPLLFIAGGIGITPFISHLLYLRQQQQTRDIVLFYAVSSMDDLSYVNILEASGIRVIIVTKTTQGPPVSSWTHHDAQYLTQKDIKKYVPDAALRTAYVSGPPQMVDLTKSILKSVGVRHINCDYFTGY